MVFCPQRPWGPLRARNVLGAVFREELPSSSRRGSGVFSENATFRILGGARLGEELGEGARGDGVDARRGARGRREGGGVGEV